MSDRDPYVMSEGEARTLQQLLRKSAPFLGGDTFGHSSSSQRAFPARVKSIETGKGAPNIDEEGNVELDGDGEPVREEADYLVCRQIDLEKQTDQTGDITVAPAFGGSAGDYAVDDDVMILHGVTGWRDLDGKPVLHREVGRASSGLFLVKISIAHATLGTNPDGDPEAFLRGIRWNPVTQEVDGSFFDIAPILGSSAANPEDGGDYEENDIVFVQSVASGWLGFEDEPINHVAISRNLNKIFPENRKTGTPSPGPGTFVVPAGVTRMMIIAAGAGGGGSGFADPSSITIEDSGGDDVVLDLVGPAGGGGGEGGTTIAIVKAIPGEAIDFTVGTGGSGGAGGPPTGARAGGDGSHTTVNNASGSSMDISITSQGGLGAGVNGDGGLGADTSFSGDNILIALKFKGADGENGGAKTISAGQPLPGHGAGRFRWSKGGNGGKNGAGGGDDDGENGGNGRVEFIW